MIRFERRTLWDRLLRLIPAIRRRQDADLEAAIRRLIADPDLPCEIEGLVIPNGWGGETIKTGEVTKNWRVY
jgi:hypothetical protein